MMIDIINYIQNSIDVLVELRANEKYEEKLQNDELKDIMFFENSNNKSDFVHLTPYKFVLIFPHEAHKPQIRIKQGLVKKAVVKLKINN